MIHSFWTILSLDRCLPAHAQVWWDFSNTRSLLRSLRSLTNTNPGRSGPSLGDPLGYSRSLALLGISSFDLAILSQRSFLFQPPGLLFDPVAQWILFLVARRLHLLLCPRVNPLDEARPWSSNKKWHMDCSPYTRQQLSTWMAVWSSSLEIWYKYHIRPI